VCGDPRGCRQQGLEEDFLPVFDALLACELVSARRKFWWFGLCAAVALGVISASDARGFRRYLRLQHELETLSNRKHQLIEQNRQLREEIQALREDPESIERAVREELGFIRPGEVVFNME
jgi:cell division protein FtsB